MRVLMTAVFVLVVSVGGGALGDAPAGKKEGEKPKGDAVPPKPATRELQLKAGYLQFDVRLTPGVPDPRQVVEVNVELAEIPPAPDPIYGERIPVKGADLIGAVIDAEGAGYSVKYRIHPLQDAGSYGFHFTPLRRDNYKVVLSGEFKGKPFDTDFRVPVGIWPFTIVDDKGNVSKVGAKAAASRLPAVPSGMTGPARPGGGTPAPRVVPGRVESPVSVVMEKMGELWADLGEALLTGRRPELSEAKALAGKLKTAVQDAASLQTGDSEYPGLIAELARAVEKLESAASSGKAGPSVKAFEDMGSQHCNRCHFKMRWGMLDDLTQFPGGLP